MSNLPWFRLYHRIVDDEKIRLLAFEDRWHFIAVCCLKADGLLDEPESDLKWRKVAVKLGVQLRELDEIKRRLSEVGLVDSDMQPVAWDALQYTAERKQQERHRERREEAGLPRRRWVNPGVRARVYERDGHSCVYCGSSENLTLDHVVSELKGGSNDESNLVAACRQCNARKREFTIEQAGMSYRPGYTPPVKQGPSKALASTETETEADNTSSLRSDDVSLAVQAYTEMADRTGLPKPRVINAERRRKISATLKAYSLDLWREAVDAIEASEFCRGGNKTGWVASLDFLLQRKSFDGLIEGRFANRQPRASPSQQSRQAQPKGADWFFAAADYLDEQQRHSGGQPGDRDDVPGVPVLTIEHQPRER